MQVEIRPPGQRGRLGCRRECQSRLLEPICNEGINRIGDRTVRRPGNRDVNRGLESPVAAIVIVNQRIIGRSGGLGRQLHLRGAGFDPLFEPCDVTGF